MGVLAHRLRTLDGFAHPPIDTSGNFPAHMSAESHTNTSPNSRHVRRKISAHVDGGLSGGSRVRRPGSKDPHRREWKFIYILYILEVIFVFTIFKATYPNLLPHKIYIPSRELRFVQCLYTFISMLKMNLHNY